MAKPIHDAKHQFILNNSTAETQFRASAVFVLFGRFVNRPYKETLNHTVGASIARLFKTGRQKLPTPTSIIRNSLNGSRVKPLSFKGEIETPLVAIATYRVQCTYRFCQRQKYRVLLAKHIAKEQKTISFLLFYIKLLQYPG